MDEATSALDSQSEFLVSQSLDEIIKGRTTITIAHRLSTIQKSDFIFVIDGGRVVEKGTYNELLAMNGVFQELVSKQFSSRD
jgi:ABC-type multidrug transport system fused ATPase/permease subunit